MGFHTVVLQKLRVLSLLTKDEEVAAVITSEVTFFESDERIIGKQGTICS